MLRRVVLLVRVVLVAVTVAAAMAAIALLLVKVAGWPLPRTVPHWTHVALALRQRNITPAHVYKVFATIAWVCWIQLLWALIVELVNRARTSRGRPRVTAPAVAGPFAALARRLVSAMFTVTVTIAATPAIAVAATRTTAATAATVPAVTSVQARPPAGVRPVATSQGPVWVVHRYDNYWQIATVAFGDGSRAGEIEALNPTLHPMALRVGQHVTLPADAAVPTDRQPGHAGDVADDNADARTVDDAHRVVVEVRAGDTLSGIIEHATGRPTTVADVAAVADANDGSASPDGAHVFHAANPDLINPGQQFTIPTTAVPMGADATRPETPAVESLLPSAADGDARVPGDDNAGPTAPDDATLITPAAVPDAPIGTSASDPDMTQPATNITPVITPSPPTPATTTMIDAAPTTSATIPVVAIPDVLPFPIGNGAATVVPVVQPGDVAATPPATTSTVRQGENRAALSPVVPLAMAGISLAGLVFGLDRRRRRRQGRQPAGHRVGLPDGDLGRDERILRAAARLDRAARVDAAIRHLTTDLAERATVLRARYVLVDDTTVTVALDDTVAPPIGWIATAAPQGWQCVLDDTALAFAAQLPHVWPALVPLGVTATGADLLVDLEACGTLAITGNAHVAQEVIAALTCALAASPLTAPLTVLDDGGVVLHGLAHLCDQRVALTTLDEVLERLEQWSEPFCFDDQHLLALRADDPGELQPCIAAVVTDIDPASSARFNSLPLNGQRPIAVLTNDASLTTNRVEVNLDGHTTFDGMAVRCHRLTGPVARAVRAITDHLDQTPSVVDTEPIIDTKPVIDTTTTSATSASSGTNEAVAVAVPTSGGTVTSCAGRCPCWSIGVLGRLHIIGPAGDELNDASMRQLMTLLALSPGGLTGDDITTAIRPDNAKGFSRKSRISELRRALGDGDASRGRHYLPAASTAGTDRYRLVDVDLDAVHFYGHVADAATVDPSTRLTVLTSALELVRGEIGADEVALWPWASLMIHKLQAGIVDAGVTLGRLALERDEPALAEWAATQTRLGVPWDQQTVVIAIDAKVALGDRVGIRRLYDELVDLHRNLEPDVQAAFVHALAS